MARYLKLCRSTMEADMEGRSQGYRMTVSVTEAVDMPSEIFVMQRCPVIDPNLPPVDRFDNIASPADLEEYAVEMVVDEHEPFYRKSSVDLIFRNMTLLDEAWRHMLEDVDGLVYSLNEMDALTRVEEVSFGVQPGPSPSSSSSAEPSSSSH